MKPLTPKRVMEILKKEGTIVTEKEAGIILEFLRTLANISVNIYIQSGNKSKAKFDSGRESSKTVIEENSL